MSGQAQGFFSGNFILNAYTGSPNILKVSMPTIENIPDNVMPDYTGLAPRTY
jgi:hypothetical protein